MNQRNVEQQFVPRMRELLTMLPYDMKVLFEAMSDEDLSVELRQMAAGAIICCLSPSDPLPDSMGLVGFIDDVVIVRLVLAKMLASGGDETSDYPDRFSEQFGQLSQDIALLRAFFGDALNWVDRRIDNLAQAKFKGKTVAEYVSDDELSQRLYEEGLEFTTEYEIDDEAVAKLTSSKPVLEAFSQRNQVEQARIDRT